MRHRCHWALLAALAIALSGCALVSPPEPDPLPVTIEYRVVSQGPSAQASAVPVFISPVQLQLFGKAEGLEVSEHEWAVDGKPVDQPFDGFTMGFAATGAHEVTLNASNGERHGSDVFRFEVEAPPEPDDPQTEDEEPSTQTVAFSEAERTIDGLSGSVTAPTTHTVGEPFEVTLEMAPTRYFQALVIQLGAAGEAIEVADAGSLTCRSGDGGTCVWFGANSGDMTETVFRVTSQRIGTVRLHLGIATKGDLPQALALSVPVEIER